MFKLDVDLSEFEALTLALTSGMRGALPELAQDLGVDAETLALEKISLQIYDTPERGYVRSGLLRESIKGLGSLTADGFEVSLTTGPGFGGEHYGMRNELGEGDSRVSLERVLADARALDDPMTLPAYPRNNDLEPRPFLIPAMATIEDELEDRILKELEALN